MLSFLTNWTFYGQMIPGIGISEWFDNFVLNPRYCSRGFLHIWNLNGFLAWILHISNLWWLHRLPPVTHHRPVSDCRHFLGLRQRKVGKDRCIFKWIYIFTIPNWQLKYAWNHFVDTCKSISNIMQNAENSTAFRSFNIVSLSTTLSLFLTWSYLPV